MKRQEARLAPRSHCGHPCLQRYKQERMMLALQRLLCHSIFLKDTSLNLAQVFRPKVSRELRE